MADQEVKSENREAGQLNLTVKDQQGHEVNFKVKSSTKFSKVRAVEGSRWPSAPAIGVQQRPCLLPGRRSAARLQIMVSVYVYLLHFVMRLAGCSSFLAREEADCCSVWADAAGCYN